MRKKKGIDMLKFMLALAAGKILNIIGKPLGKATNLPGEIALKICPDLFGRFRFDGKILAVTGSNGKTTTANAVAHILRKCGYSVTNNAKGSNLTGGVATTLISRSSFGGRIKEDFVVLEVDERYSTLIFKDFAPQIMMVTNLFRDQLTRNGNVDVIVAKLKETIRPETLLVLNANDPISAMLAPENPRVYYAMDKNDASSETSVNITHDAKVCPKCFGKMHYDYFHYNHIGRFRCTNCGYESPEAKYTAENVDCHSGSFAINGHALQTQNKNAFSILNLTAAVALCCEAGIPLQQAVEAAGTYVVSKQRFDEFTVGERKAVMILSKNQNPVSFDQSISYVLSQEGKKVVVAYVNNINHTNNKDTTWLYDISFERLNTCVDHIVCTGPRAYDLAVRLQLGGFDMEKVLVETELGKLKPVIGATEGTLYILTELYDAKAIIKAISE